MHRTLIFLVLIISFASSCKQQEKSYHYIDLSKFEDSIHHWNLYSTIRSEERLDTADIIGIADNLLAYQNTDGGWPKNIDWLAKISPDSVINDLSEHYRESTFDNRNIFSQVEYLSAVYKQTEKEKYKLAAQKGFNYILNSEHPGGGWRGWDAEVITYNDDVMTGIMNLLLDVKQQNEYYNWLNDELRMQLLDVYERGLQVILKTQVVINNKKTAWCQQHDFNTYLPAQGRKYEHPSITARESCDVILFLMKIENPDKEVKEAIISAVNWLQEAKITGYRYCDVPIKERPYHETTINFDREFVPDSTAAPVWARYYDLKNGKPFLSLVDGTIVYQLKNVSFDRRVGYEWYGFWPNKVFTPYKNWSRKYME